MRTLRVIAAEIQKDWGAKVNYAAKPYLEAMKELDLISDQYYLDTASSIVMYFLGNAQGWRGDTARRVKKELNQMLKDR
jgi:hypothetical protein